MDIKRAYKQRFYPTPEQSEMLVKTFGCARFVYNRMLRLRTDAWFNEQKSIGFHATCAMLPGLKKTPECEWLNEVSSVVLQQSLHHLQTGFNNFFAKRTKYPTFKSKHDKQSATFTKAAFKWDGNELTLAKMGTPLVVRWSKRPPKGVNVSSVTASKDATGRYFVSMLCDDAVSAKPEVAGNVGIDLGLTHFAILSTGEKIAAPNTFRKNEAKLAKLQRRMSKKVKGSANRRKARIKVARLHAKTADTRRDFLHKLSTRLVNENQVICCESLAVSNMQKNRCLAKSIADAGWSEFVRQIEYKSLWYGRTLVGIDKWYPSTKRCSECGYTMSIMPLNVREWTCPACGGVHDRDINASKNVLAAGLAVLAHGVGISPVSI